MPRPEHGDYRRESRARTLTRLRTRVAGRCSLDEWKAGAASVSLIVFPRSRRPGERHGRLQTRRKHQRHEDRTRNRTAAQDERNTIASAASTQIRAGASSAAGVRRDAAVAAHRGGDGQRDQLLGLGIERTGSHRRRTRGPLALVHAGYRLAQCPTEGRHLVENRFAVACALIRASYDDLKTGRIERVLSGELATDFVGKCSAGARLQGPSRLARPLARAPCLHVG